MKSSIYNLIIETQNPEEKILFNSFTTGMMKINKIDADLLTQNRIDELEKKQNLCKKLKENDYIIADEINEKCILKHIYELDKYNNDTFTITIAPTMSCNLACSYCFERGYKPEQNKLMDEKTQDNILKFIESISKTISGINIVWFGGEPLMGIKVIERMVPKFKKIALENNITYFSSMTTNGIFIAQNPAIIGILKKNNIQDFQITLDGNKIEHNKRRKYKDGDKDTFEDIIKSIQLLKENSFTVSIRVNIDLNNYKTIDELLKILNEKDLINLDISFGHLRDYSDKTNPCYATVKQFCDITFQLQKSLNKYRNRDKQIFNYPVVAKPCVANKQNAIVVDNNGYIYKCRTLIGNKENAYGNINNSLDSNLKSDMNLSKWISWSPFDYEKCNNCRILPLCMGNCTYNCIREKNSPECNEWNYFLKKQLLDIYNEKNKSS